MDGVLVDTEPLYIEMTRQLFKQLGITMSLEEYQAFVGISSADMWCAIKQQFGLSQSVEALLRLKTDTFTHKLKALPHLDPIPGVVPFINALRGAGICLAIASSSLRMLIDLITSRTGLSPYFDAIVSGVIVMHSKLNPEIFLTAAERLRVAPKHCLVIEGSPHGVAGAKRADIRCAGFQNPNSGNQDLSQIDLLIHDFSSETLTTIMNRLVQPN